MTNQLIQAKNDAFRKTVMGGKRAPDGKAVRTVGVAGLGGLTNLFIQSQIANFKDWTEGNDPYGEHDFGSVTVSVSNHLTGELETHKVFWKIDYYADASMEFGTEDKLNCYRVLIIMLSEEY